MTITTEVEAAETWREDDDWQLWHETTLALFRDVREFFCQYIVFPSWMESVAVTLWVLHTHLIDRFDTTPRLVIKAPEKQSGKTRVLDVLELVVQNAQPAANMSVSTFFRSIGDGNCTIIQDEYDAIFSDGTYEELRGAYNAGWERGKPFKRSEGSGRKFVVKSYNIFAPLVLAGIGDLPETDEPFGADQDAPQDQGRDGIEVPSPSCSTSLATSFVSGSRRGRRRPLAPG